jgi:hypothetical protein
MQQALEHQKCQLGILYHALKVKSRMCLGCYFKKVPNGVEPLTFRLLAERSNQLS